MEEQTVQSLKDQLERLNNIEYALRRTITMRKLYGQFYYDLNLQVIFPDSLSPSLSNTSTDRIQSLSEDELREREKMVEQMENKVHINTEPIYSETDINDNGFSRKECIEKIKKLNTGMSDSDKSIVSEYDFDNAQDVDNTCNLELNSSHSSFEDSSLIKKCSYNNSGFNSEVEYLHKLSPQQSRNNSIFRGSTMNKYCRMSPPKDGPNRNVFMIKEKSRRSSAAETISEYYSKHDRKTKKTGRLSNDSDTSNNDNCKGYSSNNFDSKESTCNERKCTSIRDSLRNVASGISTNTFDDIDPIPTSETATMPYYIKLPSSSVSEHFNYISNKNSSSSKEEFDDSLSEKNQTENKKNSAEKEIKKKKKLLKKISKKNTENSASTSEAKSLSTTNNCQRSYENSKYTKKPSKHNMLFKNTPNIDSDNSEENYIYREKQDKPIEVKPSKNNLLFNRVKTPYYVKKRYKQIGKTNQQNTEKYPSIVNLINTKQNTQYYKKHQSRNYSKNHQQIKEKNISRFEKKPTKNNRQNVDNAISLETIKNILKNENCTQENCDSQANKKLPLDTKKLFTETNHKYDGNAFVDAAEKESKEMCEENLQKRLKISLEEKLSKSIARFRESLEQTYGIENEHCDDILSSKPLPVIENFTNKNKKILKENQIESNSGDLISSSKSTISFNVCEELYKHQKLKLMRKKLKESYDFSNTRQKNKIKKSSKTNQLIGQEANNNSDIEIPFIDKKSDDFISSGQKNNGKKGLEESCKINQFFENKIPNHSGDERIDEKSSNTSYERKKEESNKSSSSKNSVEESIFFQGKKFSDYHKKYLLPLQEKLHNLESFLLRGQNTTNKTPKKSSNPSSDDCNLTNNLKLNCESGQRQIKDHVDKSWEEGDGIALVRTTSTANLLRPPLKNPSEFTVDSKTKSNLDSGIEVSVNDTISPQHTDLKQVYFFRKFDTLHKTISISPQIINSHPIRNIIVQTTEKKLQFTENMQLKFIVSPKQLHSSSSENSLHTVLRNKNPLEKRPKMIRIKNNRMKFVNFPPSHTSISSNYSDSGSDDNSSGQKANYGFVRINNIRKMVRQFIRKQ